MCNRPLVLAVCLNHEVVVFQPQKRTAPDLGSVASYKFYFSPPTLPFLTVFLDLSISLLHPTAATSVTVCHCTTSICYTCSPHPLPVRNAVYLGVVHIRHLPESAAQICTPTHVPASYVVSCGRLLSFSNLGLNLGPCQIMRVHP